MTPQYYFDHAASAPRRDEVVAAMEPWLRGVVGNPSGSHRAAREARRAVEEARDEVAEFVGAKPGGVIFTAGGTESCHLAIAGVTHHHRRTHDASAIVISRTEHNAVLDAAEMMARDFENVTVRFVDVDAEGVLDLESLRQALDVDVAIVSVMAANNETGICQPLDGVSALAHAVPNGVLTHTDAVAGAPWLYLPMATSTIDMISICAHKIGGPVNSGALILRSDIALDAMVPGGGQERGRRGGTVDVAACVGLAAAARITASKVPGTVHVTFEGIVSDELLFLLDQEGVCASAASSCSSGAGQSSHVLAAMGMALERSRGSLRLSMGPETTLEEVDALIGILSSVVYRLATEA
jgi:cysteine desulfurase